MMIRHIPPSVSTIMSGGDKAGVSTGVPVARDEPLMQCDLRESRRCFLPIFSPPVPGTFLSVSPSPLRLAQRTVYR